MNPPPKFPNLNPLITKLDIDSVGKFLTNQTPRGAKEIDYQEEAKSIAEQYKKKQLLQPQPNNN